METLILLTIEQADQVRGNYGKYSALDPIATDNGMFILPVDVLDDPEHKEVLSQLGECKFAEIKVTDVINTKLPEGDPLRVKQVLTVLSVNTKTISEETKN